MEWTVFLLARVKSEDRDASNRNPKTLLVETGIWYSVYGGS
jgi:hypothetical protein